MAKFSKLEEKSLEINGCDNGQCNHELSYLMALAANDAGAYLLHRDQSTPVQIGNIIDTLICAAHVIGSDLKSCLEAYHKEVDGGRDE